MNKKTMTPAALRRFVARSTKASALLERRVVPADHVRSAKAEAYVASLSSQA
jgi:hypothetical protein